MPRKRRPLLEKRVQGMIPKADFDQMVQLSRINDRSMSAELRSAVVEWLVKNGRRVRIEDRP